jgi:hypothetical protein
MEIHYLEVRILDHKQTATTKVEQTKYIGTWILLKVPIDKQKDMTKTTFIIIKTNKN